MGPCRYSPLVSQLEAGWRRAGPCRYYASVDVPSVLSHCWLGGKKGIRPVKTEWWGAGVVICMERGADLHMARLMSLPLTVSCFSKVQTGFTVLVPAHPGSPGQKVVKWVCVCVCVCKRGCLTLSVLPRGESP